MAVRGFSPFVGRRDELRELAEAAKAASAGSGGVLVIGGDAGIGKSRLLDAFQRSLAEQSWWVAQANCVEVVNGGIAFGPLGEVVRTLQDFAGVTEFGELAAGRGGELAEIAHGASTSVAPGRILEVVTDVLRAAGEVRPTVVVIEDVQWADPSTLDLVRYVSGSLRRSRVVVVVTFRADDVHRRHPLRPLLAELTRSRVPRIDLTALSNAEVSALVTALSGGRADREAVARVVERAEGNPFFVEELTAVLGSSRLPATLAEAALARVDQLPEPVLAVLRPASVIGRVVHERLLSIVAGLSGDVVAAGLRQALGANVIDTGPEGRPRFRHDLIREAIYNDLLPDERARWHAGAAQTLQAHADVVAPELLRWTLAAHHWTAAGDNARAFAASVTAGRLGARFGGREAVAQFDRARALWGQLPDPDGGAGTDHAGLLCEAAVAYEQAAEPRRAIEALEAAACELEAAGAEPERIASTLIEVGRLYPFVSDRAASLRALEAATALLADRPPSPAKALAAAYLASNAMIHSEDGKAIAAARSAIELARGCGYQLAEAHATTTLGTSLIGTGHLVDGLALLRTAYEMCKEIGDVQGMFRALNNASFGEMFTGDARATVADAEAGLAIVREHGSEILQGTSLKEHLGFGLLRLGKWDTIREMHRDYPFAELAQLNFCAGAGAMFSLALRRGELEDARAVIDAVLFRADSEQPQVCAYIHPFAGELALTEKRLDDARGHVDKALASTAPTDDCTFSPKVLWLGIAVEAATLDQLDRRDADGRTAAVHRATAHLRNLADIQQRVTDGEGTLLPEPAAFAAMAGAECAQLHEADPRAWDPAVQAWEECADPYWTAYTRYRRADATLLAAGDRDAAVRDLRAARHTANGLGATPLVHDIDDLARRARLPLHGDHDHHAAAPDLGLTTRELEILDLVAAGLTNTEIGARLFISPKTASVHVSNLLRKLGVDNRTQAAAVAVRTRPSAVSNS